MERKLTFDELFKIAAKRMEGPDSHTFACNTIRHSGHHTKEAYEASKWFQELYNIRNEYASPFFDIPCHEQQDTRVLALCFAATIWRDENASH